MLSDMLDTDDLRKAAEYIGRVWATAHRGAVLFEEQSSVVAFGNEGWVENGHAVAGVENARRALRGDGWKLGPVVVSADGWTWCFEAVPTFKADDFDTHVDDEHADAVREAVWEGWDSVRRLSGVVAAEAAGYAEFQKQNAASAVAGQTLTRDVLGMPSDA